MNISYLVILITLVSFSISYAGQKVFYDPVSGKEIVDISGKKTREQIKSEFNLTQVEETALADGDGYRVKNGAVEKYDRKAEAEAAKNQKEQDRQAKEDAIKQKLGLTNKEFEDLREALKK